MVMVGASQPLLRRVTYTLLLLGWLTSVALGPFIASGQAFERSDRDADVYIMSQAREFFSSNAPVQDVISLSKKMLSGDFLWVRRAGKEWVFRDAQTLKAALRLFEPLNGLESEREAIQRRQEQLAADEAALDDEEERLEEEVKALEEEEGGQISDSARVALTHRQLELKSRLRAVKVRERELDTNEKALDARSDELERKAESALWDLVEQAIRNGLGRAVGPN
ncbi:MAG TPA: hypothetical protein VNN55_10505 [bacterium]|nr:hypothetical protein [bacterium]